MGPSAALQACLYCLERVYKGETSPPRCISALLRHRGVPDLLRKGFRPPQTSAILSLLISICCERFARLREKESFCDRCSRHRDDVINAFNGNRQRPLLGDLDEAFCFEVPEMKFKLLV